VTEDVPAGAAGCRGDLLVRRIGRLLTMVGPPVESAAVVVRDGRVAWTGAERDLPAGSGELPSIDAEGAAVVPGFVDPHTHLVWAGSRRAEFVARLAGERYDGGGIGVTVAATRSAGTDELVRLTVERARAALASGTTTMEIKTGYGLSRDDELRLLDVIAAVGNRVPVRIEPTYLGAHVVPAGRDRADYVAEVVDSMPEVRRRGARWCDVFCDSGAFSVAETRRILDAGRSAGLGLRLHADQLDRIGAAGLAAESGCASADHLDRIDRAGARALAAAGTVGVLVPTATLSTRSSDWGQAAILSEAGVTIALATDCNPGTSWCESMPYVLSLACLGLGMTVRAALRAATRGAAAALRREDVGHLGVGAYGDLVVLAAAHEADLVAHLGAPAVRRTVVGGVPV
jgi:imidazolonepropionase